MKNTYKLLFIAMIFLFNGCSHSAFTSMFPYSWFHSEPKHVTKAKLDYKKFKEETNLRKSFKVFEDKRLLKDSNAKNTKKCRHL